MKPSSAPAVSSLRLKILFIGHSHHALTKSSEFFINWLRGIGDVSVEFDDYWTSRVERDYRPMVGSFDMVIVWQVAHVVRKLAGHGHGNLIFVPMYDSILKQKKAFWRSLKSVKIVCFSASLRAICLSNKLDTYFIQYYPAGADVSPGGYATKRMFFWQRKAWPNWQTVTSILPACQFEKLHLHVSIDPGVKIAEASEMAPTLSETQQAGFGTSEWFDRKSELIEKLREFNVFFLPREREGIGFSFLDSMEMGLVPVGFDRPTFNEYVVDGINGFLVEKDRRMDLPALEEPAARMRHYLRKGRGIYLRRLAGLEAFLRKPVEIPEYYNSGVHKIFPGLQRKWRGRKLAAVTAARARNGDNEPLVTVITVANRDAPGLSRTFQSVFGQIHHSIEYMVVDSEACARSRDLIRQHEGSIDIILREKGGTPGDLLVKAVAAASGRYVLFLEPGDGFSDTTSIADAFQDAPEDAGVIYGHSYQVSNDDHVSLKHARSLGTSLQMLRDKKPIPKGWVEGVPISRSSFIERSALLELLRRQHHFSNASLVMEFLAGDAIPYHANTVITRLGGAAAGISEAETIAALRKISFHR
ncbi:MAG: glycosyltransferase [Verrucomicrobiota bacterium]